MTIKAFAGLCGCKPQTLRYYDQIELLKPVRVDPWSGYRYYDEEQALTFVKIKSLQSAGFRIDEIRQLLDGDNDAICEALGRKIAEQEDKLQRLKSIRQSYQSEMKQMKQKLLEVREQVSQAMLAYDPGDEFGISADRYRDIIRNVSDFFENMIAAEGGDIEYSVFPDGEVTSEEDEYIGAMNDPAYEIIYEKHAWDRVRDFFDELETPENGEEYILYFEVTRDKANQTAFANTVLGLLIGKNYGRHKENDQLLQCQVTLSKDEKNHFWLLRRK